MLQDGLVWSNLILGAATLICGLILLPRTRVGATIFFAAGASASAGALFHAAFGSIFMPPGSLLWMFVLAAAAASALALSHYAFGQLRLVPVWLLIFLGYLTLAYAHDRSLIWTGVLQIGGSILYGLSLLASAKKSANQQTVVYFIAYAAVTIFSAIIGTAGGNSGLVVFHLSETLAAICLFLSIRAHR